LAQSFDEKSNEIPEAQALIAAIGLSGRSQAAARTEALPSYVEGASASVRVRELGAGRQLLARH
jgi:hypothetical protein